MLRSIDKLYRPVDVVCAFTFPSGPKCPFEILKIKTGEEKKLARMLENLYRDNESRRDTNEGASEINRSR